MRVLAIVRNAVLAEVLEIMLPKDEEVRIALVSDHSRVLWLCEYFRPHAIVVDSGVFVRNRKLLEVLPAVNARVILLDVNGYVRPDRENGFKVMRPPIRRKDLLSALRSGDGDAGQI